MRQSKGELTRQRIVETAAPVFNRRGFAGASMTHLMEAAGLEKGGLYRHFASKDTLALAAFDHAVRLAGQRIRQCVLEGGPTAAGRMLGVARGMATSGLDPAVPGGCPLLNTAIEVDDPSIDGENAVYPELRIRTRRAMNDLLRVVRRIVGEGVASGEFIAEVDAEAEASLLVATMEGGLLLMRLYDDPSHLHWALQRVEDRGAQLTRKPPRTPVVPAKHRRSR
ncbi:MAG TPA: TetR/AcrR family transcriptional regulator [Gemmatimonas sp.]|uniref:TetR/AcrR family transcriptional regulator n=1 Tax=Gemmatimonas sp. TaxID=1962908 RepID=UPI002ED86358